MDLSNFDLVSQANEASVMTVTHPITGQEMTDDNGEPVTITLLGAESTVLKSELRKRAKKAIQSGKKNIDIEQVEREAADMLAALTVSWTGLSENGEPLVFSKQAASEIYFKYSWLRDQVDSFVNDRQNFWSA